MMLYSFMVCCVLLIIQFDNSAICYSDMDKEGANCDDLILKTSQALGSETLELFCLSILRNDVESRIRDVINL